MIAIKSNKELIKLNVLTVFAAVVFIAIYWNLTYTMDWAGYEYAFSHEEVSRDAAFTFFSNFFDERGWDYRALFRFHIVLMGVFFAWQYKQLRVNPLSFIALGVLANYVAYVNQIRFYVALPLVLIALYHWMQHRVLPACLLAVVGCYFHFSLVVFIAVFVFYASVVEKHNIRTQIFIVAMMNIIVAICFDNRFFVNEQYENYYKAARISSILGDLFNLTPAMVAWFFITKIYATSRKNNGMREFERCRFLYTVCMCSTLLILISLRVQIFATRMIIALFPLWIAYFGITVQSISVYVRNLSKIATVVTFSYFLFWRYFLPLIFGVNGEFIQEMSMMLASYS